MFLEELEYDRQKFEKSRVSFQIGPKQLLQSHQVPIESVAGEIIDFNRMRLNVWE